MKREEMKVYECGCCHRWHDAVRHPTGDTTAIHMNNDPQTGEIWAETRWAFICPDCLKALQDAGSAPPRRENVIH